MQCNKENISGDISMDNFVSCFKAASMPLKTKIIMLGNACFSQKHVSRSLAVSAGYRFFQQAELESNSLSLACVPGHHLDFFG
ncbi:MAG: hypothetical protein GY696_19170 [Gammaproteobacteria bacterium]|nr:hypothetical protein [Gammaproteobacteria bacterium]